MIKIAEINAFNFGSTGTIMERIADVARKQEIEVRTYCPKARMTRSHRNDENYLFGTILERRGSEYVARLLSLHDCLNFLGTKQLIHLLEQYQPDIIHIHNLHGDYVNLNMLFNFINNRNIKIVWTFHDCWPFTGHCPYFTYIKCEKWKKECKNCGQYKEYPQSCFDDSKKMFYKKRNWFTGINHLTIVTPSQWLADQVKSSFLKDYPVKVINNGIDLNIFRPTESNFKSKYGLVGKTVLLGVAFLWDRRKGLDRILKIADSLDDNFRFVLVGQMQTEIANTKIIHIPRTASKTELAEIYTAADIFINTTFEDNFPTVNIEALACGTPVLTYNTGGSPEAIDIKTGAVIDDHNVIDMILEWRDKKGAKQDCINRAGYFSDVDRFNQYVKLYRTLLSDEV